MYDASLKCVAHECAQFSKLVWYDDCVPRIRILDASTEEYQEEEEVYFQGEEDHFDQFPNQGKIILLQSAKLTMSKALPHLLYAYDPTFPVLLYQLYLPLFYQSTFDL